MSNNNSEIRTLWALAIVNALFFVANSVIFVLDTSHWFNLVSAWMSGGALGWVIGSLQDELRYRRSQR